MATIAERIYGQLTGEFSPTELVLNGVPDAGKGPGPGHDISDDQQALEYACVVGMAWVVAKLDSPLASEDQIEAEATQAACDAYRWLSTVGGKEGEDANLARA